MLSSRSFVAPFARRPVALLLPALLVLTACEKKSPSTSAAAPTSSAPTAAAPAASTPAATATPTTPAAIKRVLGRWQRTDGDYTLALLGGENGGILQAQYFNPKSINVSRAAWIDSGGRLQVLVELNDVGYPGATYVLHLDPTTDRLVGQYKQPAQQQTYDIEFTRLAPSPLK